MSKTFASSYLYSIYAEYEKELFNFIMSGEQINKLADSFYDIKYEVKKRQISNSLIKVLESDNVILIINNNPLPKPFKVFAAKDVKGDKKLKTFIDCTGLIGEVNGSYVCDDIDILIAHLVSAMNNLIYYIDEKRIVGNNDIATSGAKCFSALLTHIIDYLCKISINPTTKNKCIYMTSLYFLVNILEKDLDDNSARAISRKISGLSEREEEIIRLQTDKNTFLNIKFFIESLTDVLKLNSVSLDVVTAKWMYLFGNGTVFGLEMYTSFTSMITDAYVGCYINNQKTIEKVCGRNMVDYTKTVLRIGDGAV